mmetsp:Transcript_30680/g.60215  ORF Transcript_30680/g.60215 Transcript_30680/m.60215 type:complete len:162 (+) Transcript_30680:107-592(+)
MLRQDGQNLGKSAKSITSSEAIASRPPVRLPSLPEHAGVVVDSDPHAGVFLDSDPGCGSASRKDSMLGKPAATVSGLACSEISADGRTRRLLRLADELKEHDLALATLEQPSPLGVDCWKRRALRGRRALRLQLNGRPRPVTRGVLCVCRPPTSPLRHMSS